MSQPERSSSIDLSGLPARAAEALAGLAGGSVPLASQPCPAAFKEVERPVWGSLSDRGLAIGSGVVEAANKILVTQRMKRSGMRWRIPGGQAVLTVRALLKSERFDRAWATLMGGVDTPANDNNCAGYAARRAA